MIWSTGGSLSGQAACGSANATCSIKGPTLIWKNAIARQTRVKLEKRERETEGVGCWASQANAALCSLISTLRGHSMASAATPFSPIDFAIFLTPASLGFFSPSFRWEGENDGEGVMLREEEKWGNKQCGPFCTVFFYSLTFFSSVSVITWIIECFYNNRCWLIVVPSGKKTIEPCPKKKI